MKDFKTAINIIITGDEKGHPNGSGGRANVKWECNFELGNSSKDPANPQFFGIQGILITVPDQVITFMSSFYDEETDEETEKQVTIELKDVKVSDDLGECSLSNFQLLPVELSIYKDTFELKFS